MISSGNSQVLGENMKTVPLLRTNFTYILYKEYVIASEQAQILPLRKQIYKCSIWITDLLSARIIQNTRYT